MSDSARGFSSRKRKLFWSYLPDWALSIALWGLFYLLNKVDGYRRFFSVTDASLAHPYAQNERIPVWLLVVLCGVVPAVLIIVNGFVSQKSFWDAHCGILGLILGLGLGQTFTTIIKICAGRPRPDLFARCRLPASVTQNPVHELTSWTACTQSSLLEDGFRSFPSGHASFAWTGMWYLTLYAAAKLRLFNKQGHTWKAWLLLAPLSCSTLISISRTMDYRHHSTDVIAGGTIGVLSAWFSYRQFFPHPCSAEPYKAYRTRHKPQEHSIPLHITRTTETQSAADTHTQPSPFSMPNPGREGDHDLILSGGGWRSTATHGHGPPPTNDNTQMYSPSRYDGSNRMLIRAEP